MHHGQAAGTFNLFGVKADKNWDGQTKDIVTHEYINGEKITVTDKFRVYSSYDESLLDRAKFLQENPRYDKLRETGTKGDFLKESIEIQKAGWATDPEYAQNLAAVFQGKIIREVLKIITERNFTAGFGDFTNPNATYKTYAIRLSAATQFH
jgi:flagellum-specific peptidoglycan hydrolase FlgJ